MLKKEDFPISEITVGKKLKAKLEDAFDVNFNVSSISVNSMDDFYKELYYPYKNDENIYYRGERINSFSRRLVPTILRKENSLAKLYVNEKIFNINSEVLFDFYVSKEQFISVYNVLYSKPEIDKMYDMLAFAQHYLDISPFIDFSKNLFVALSFALKGRTQVDEDIVIYTAFDIGEDDTTTNLDEVNLWLKNYNVNLISSRPAEEIWLKQNNKLKLEKKQQNIKRLEPLKLQDIFDGLSPTAKLIDIPTNDLMKYQQGVFLLLNDFSLVDLKYLTKTIRQSFVINKYVIDKRLAMDLSNLLFDECPQYRYECLMNISKAVKA